MNRRMIAMLLFGLLLAACGSQASTSTPTTAPAAATNAPAPTAIADTATAAPGAETTTLTIMTHDSFSVSEAVLKAFEQQNNAKVEVLKSGDAGQALNKAALSKDAPLADVFFGVDNTFLTRALKVGIFEPYAAPALGQVPAQYKLDPSNSLLPIDYGFVAINYDKAYLEKNKLTPPTTLEDLTKPEWKGKLVVENAATSSPGLAFLLATIGHFGTEGSYTWLDYWKALRANDVLVVDGWSDAYYTQFSGSSGQGPRPLVVSYASSPPAEVFFSEGKLTEPPTAVMAGGNFLQIEFAGILKGSKHRALAEKFIDFMYSKPFQEDMPLQMFVYPVLPGSALPEVFTKFAAVPAQPISVPPEQIDQNREQWLDAWTKAVLR